MRIIIGSARIDERGKISGGTVGDQKQTSSTNDTKGEVGMQNFYVHSKGWYILRPISDDIAVKIADAMKIACNNKNIGYDQYNRLGVLKYGVNSKTKTECDCSGLIRACIKEASGKDVGNFNTANEASVLEASGLFEKRRSYRSGTTLYIGDILVTKSKGHTVAVVDGNPRKQNENSTVTSTMSSSKYIYNALDYSPVFDPTYYTNKYVDLKKTFGNNATALFNHFLNFGMKEKRQANEIFNVEIYKNNYVDLQKAFGNNYPEYYKHYCQFGEKEGRKAI